MSWLSPKEDKTVNAEAEAGKPKEGEKTQAELIAESVGAALKPFMEAQAARDARLDAIEANTRRPEPTREPTEMASVLDNEDLAFAQRIGPVMLAQLETNARMALADVKQEYAEAGYGDAWKEFAKDINTVLEASPVVGADGKPIRGNPDYIRNVVDMVFGRAAKKAGIKFGGRDRGFFIESAGGGDTNVGGGAPNDGLTPEQVRAFTKMGLTREDAKKSLSKLKFIA